MFDSNPWDEPDQYELLYVLFPKDKLFRVLEYLNTHLHLAGPKDSCELMYINRAHASFTSPFRRMYELCGANGHTYMSFLIASPRSFSLLLYMKSVP